MKKIKGSLVVLIVAMLFVFVFIFNDNLDGTMTVIKNANIWYFLLSIAVIIIGNVFRGIGYSLIFKNMNIKHKFFEAFNFAVISQLFDGITPFSSGGQPYQVYYLKKKYDIGYSVATGLVFYISLTFQMALLIIGTIMIILNSIYKFISPEPIIGNLIFIGYVITFAFTLVLTIINLDRVHGKIFLKKLIDFLKRIRILKEKLYNKFNGSINNFFDSLEHLHSSNKLLIKNVLCNVFYLICMIIIPVFIMNSVMPDIKMPIVASTIAATYIMLATTFIPVPGGTIGQEFAYISLYSTFAISSVVKAGMLLWRFITYYLVLIIGFVLFLFFRKKYK